MTMTRSTYSEKLRAVLDEIRPAFRDLGQGLDRLTQKRAELAPAFMKAYAVWRRETHRPFIAFVHELDRSMPVTDRTAYRSHPSYRAAEYLKQLAAAPDGPSRRGLTPLAALAVTIKSFLPLCGKRQKDALAVLLAATKWREADQARLLGKIRRARAVGLPGVPVLVDAAKATKAAVIAFERERIAS